MARLKPLDKYAETFFDLFRDLEREGKDGREIECAYAATARSMRNTLYAFRGALRKDGHELAAFADQFTFSVQGTKCVLAKKQGTALESLL